MDRSQKHKIHQKMSVADESPVKRDLVLYHNPYTGVEIYSMLEVHPDNKNKRRLEFELPPHRSIKKLHRIACNASCSSVSEWASLPKDILLLMLHKLFEPIDHVRLAAVCSHWHKVSKEHNHTTQRWCNLLPMLMIPPPGPLAQ
ncbi:putative F-box domain-containing protein [Rosa chinensis]|uniref:Putative F-box domain-containing protein n=1 Tax=Rosa chinensis TaxID=74649 RepID=A0A2P6R3N9_ROSCH|nr:putative F-box domain-containing protein [Rosa chinensis]